MFRKGHGATLSGSKEAWVVLTHTHTPTTPDDALSPSTDLLFRLVDHWLEGCDGTDSHPHWLPCSLHFVLSVGAAAAKRFSHGGTPTE
jgi:hypothetical protein